MSGTVKDARVMSPRGDVAAETLRGGCVVLSLGGRACLVVDGSTDTVFGCVDVRLEDGGSLRLAPRQMLPMLDGADELAGMLAAGDMLLDYAGRPLQVAGIVYHPVYLTVCRISTESGTYIAERVALHAEKS